MNKLIITSIFIFSFCVLSFGQVAAQKLDSAAIEEEVVVEEVQKQDVVVKEAQKQDSTVVKQEVVVEKVQEEVQAEAPAQEEAVLEESDDNSLYVMVQVMPEFPGGVDSMKVFINSNMNYEKIATTKTTDELARIEFVIEKDGSMSNLAILKTSGNKAFDNEAMRVVRTMPEWSPGVLEGKLVRTKIIIPVRFNK